MWKDITEKEKKDFDRLAQHPLQTFSWGDFREKTGITVVRRGKFENDKLTKILQVTVHPLPHLPYTVGYYPKGVLPDKDTVAELTRIGKQYKCIFMQVEPNAEKTPTHTKTMKSLGLIPSRHPLFPKHTLILDLTPTEDALLAAMHPKTRYNIKVAQRHGVEIVEDNSTEALSTFWKLMEETTKRQGFFAHSKRYFSLMWDTFAHTTTKDTFSAHLFLAKYQEKTLAAWIVFIFKDTLYYPYGDSTREFRNVMAPNLMMWEVIRFGKKNKLKTFDMWGALGEDATESDPWFGFHQFKQRYGATIHTFVGSHDLVIHPILYQMYKLADSFRYILLRAKR